MPEGVDGRITGVNDSTHYCDRCKGNFLISEWSYDSTAFQGQGGWRHDKCLWIERVPRKI